jgi:protein-arginine kinase activator protein McsA
VISVKNLGDLDFQMCMLLLVACYQVGKSYQSINQVQLMVEANCYAQFQ